MTVPHFGAFSRGRPAFSRPAPQTSGAAAQAIEDRNPRIWLELDEESGTPANSGSHPATISVNGSPVYQQSTSKGNGIRLGSGDYITVTNAGWVATDVGGGDIGLSAIKGVAETDPKDSEVVVVVEAVIHTLADDLPLLAMDDDETAHQAMAWSLRAMADGSIVMRERSRDRPVEMASPAGTLTAGQSMHFALQFGRDGLGVWVDGRLLWGFRHPAAWHGWDVRIWNQFTLALERRRMLSDLTIGKVGTNDTGDVTFSQMAVFVRDAYANAMAVSDIEDLAQGSGAQIEHPIFGQDIRTPLAGPDVLQAVIDDLTSTGGGMIDGQGQTFVQTVNLELKSNVMLRNMTIDPDVDVLIFTAKPTLVDLTITEDVSPGTLTYACSNTLSDNACVYLAKNTAFETEFEMNLTRSDGLVSEMVPLKSRTSTTITFDRAPVNSYPSAEQTNVIAFEPVMNVALENVDCDTETKEVLQREGIRGGWIRDSTWRVINPTEGGDRGLMPPDGCVDHHVFNCDLQAPDTETQPDTGANHPYTYQLHACRDCVVHSCDLLSGGYHTFDAVWDNMADDWPAETVQSTFYVAVRCDLISSTSDATQETQGSRVPIHTHIGAQQFVFRHCHMTPGGGFGGGGAGHDVQHLTAGSSAEFSGSGGNIGFFEQISQSYLAHFDFEEDAQLWFNAGSSDVFRSNRCVSLRKGGTSGNQNGDFSNNTYIEVDDPVPSA